ncbi:MAG TPA: FHA domain-containing protein [Aggregatilineales bacterium]|nr:FHA domain-containing protein [Aggregatilineales bacterium]
MKLNVMIMSGFEDGTNLTYDPSQGDGQQTDDTWEISIGRKEENDLCLRNDTYVSRLHANIIWKNNRWWLQDHDSTNGTFIENKNDFFDDQPIKGTIGIEEEQLFRVGRTWLRIQVIE